MYGLGMNNNGTGLVLASMALADHPTVMLPIIFYNLVQQIAAGIVNDWQARRALPLQADRSSDLDPLSPGFKPATPEELSPSPHDSRATRPQSSARLGKSVAQCAATSFD